MQRVFPATDLKHQCCGNVLCVWVELFSRVKTRETTQSDLVQRIGQEINNILVRKGILG